jgi:L-alanine-DL-glutamate epimerase-like enolase superfamily enzyme
MSSINIPLVEYFPPHGRDGDTFLGELVTGAPEVRDGYMYITDAPGLGVELNTKIVSA